MAPCFFVYMKNLDTQPTAPSIKNQAEVAPLSRLHLLLHSSHLSLPGPDNQNCHMFTPFTLMEISENCIKHVFVHPLPTPPHQVQQKISSPNLGCELHRANNHFPEATEASNHLPGRDPRRRHLCNILIFLGGVSNKIIT